MERRDTGGQGDHGVVLAVDVGSVRTGVAVSDPQRVLASPLVTLPGGQVAGAAQSDAPEVAVAGLVRGHAATLVVVGWPVGLSGTEGAAGALARGFAERLAPLVAVPVRLVDERFTTTTAHAHLQASGRRGRRARAVVDQAAAVVLLQLVLDAARRGVELGAVVEPAGAA